METEAGVKQSGRGSGRFETGAFKASRRALLGAVAAAFLGAGAGLVYKTWGPPRTLEQMEARVASRWPKVAKLSRAGLAGHIAPTTAFANATIAANVVLFDVREANEHAVSHIPGSIRIDPEISREGFLATHGPSLQGKMAVFYCAVGVRSALVIRDLEPDIRASGAAHVYNLDGGIFGWHNDQRPLVDARGTTEQVHGFARRWSRLIVRQSLVQMTVK
jgi:rhodanese-related sulfurtransferase